MQQHVDLALQADSREVAAFLPLVTKKQEYEMTICSDSVDLSGHLRIVDQVASELSRTKPRICIFLIFMCGFFAVFNVIHLNLLGGRQQFSHCFLGKI